MYCSLDIETTGTDPWRNEILSLGAIVAGRDRKIIGEFETKARPLNFYSWSKDAEEVHGISVREALEFPDPDVALHRFIEFLHGLEGYEGFSLVCHALPFKSRIDLFDRNFIFSWFWSNDHRSSYYRFFPEQKMESTIIRSKKQAHALWGVENQKLGTWASKLGIQFDHHDSFADAKMCYEVWKFQQAHKEFHL